MTRPSTTAANGLVWDASALHHMGKANRLDVLGSYVTGRNRTWRHYVTDIVVAELEKHGIDLPEWCTIVAAADIEDLSAFADWTRLMSDGRHDLGEASVAAWAGRRGMVAIIDDRDARLVANKNGCDAHGSLWLLCHCINDGAVDVTSVSSLVDAAGDAGARWPFGRHGFRSWAIGKKLIPAP